MAICLLLEATNILYNVWISVVRLGAEGLKKHSPVQLYNLHPPFTFLLTGSGVSGEAVVHSGLGTFDLEQWFVECSSPDGSISIPW